MKAKLWFGNKFMNSMKPAGAIKYDVSQDIGNKLNQKKSLK